MYFYFIINVKKRNMADKKIFLASIYIFLIHSQFGQLNDYVVRLFTWYDFFLFIKNL